VLEECGVMRGKKVPKKLDDVVAYIQKQMGEEAIMRLGETKRRAVDVVPTGSLALDLALGTGGLPRGRVVEIYGPDASGKTTLALHVVANAQKMGGTAAFIDAEHALDVEYAKRLGVDVENLLLSQPDYGEQALQVAEMLVSTGEVDIVVIDSVAALVPKAELEGQMGDQFVGLQARMMSQALRKLAGVIARSRCLVVFINQIREKVGVMFGSPEVTSGGRALKFYASVRIDVRRMSLIKDSDGRARGTRVNARVLKNKLAPPFRDAQFEIVYAEGISQSGGVLDCALERGLVTRNGAWFSCGDERLGQGREAAIRYLEEHPELATRLEKEILESAGIVRKGAET